MRSNESVVSLTSNETAIKIYQGFIDPYFIYWLPVWDGLGSTLDIFLITICLFFYLFKACRGYFPLETYGIMYCSIFLCSGKRKYMVHSM